METKKQVKIYISPPMVEKLRTKHNVEPAEVIECFGNQGRSFLDDIRPQHLTVPKTIWFIAETDAGRELKIACIYYQVELKFDVKSAFVPNATEKKIYAEKSLPIGIPP